MYFVSKLVLLGLSSLVLTACLPEPEEIAPPPNLIRPVKIITVSDQSNKNLRTFPATVEAVNEAKLTFRVGGQIIKRPVKAGQEVRKGQLIAQLDPKDFQTQVFDRQARFNLAKAQYDRAAKVVKEGHVSRADFDSRKAEMLAAKAALKQAKDNLSYTKIYAPFSGEVSQVYADNHELVSTSQPIVMMQSSDNIYIAFQVPEQIVASVEDREEAKKAKNQVIFDARPDQSFLADFHEIDTQADSATRTYKVRLLLKKPQNFNVLPGMSAKVVVDLALISNKSKTTVKIPPACVFESENDGLKYVWIYDNNTSKVSKRPVSVGALTESGLEILNGVKLGEQIVAAGVNQIHENTKVRPLTSERGL
ncbi:efflux RND transporter periplasmic adaptor subunit [Candidatus Albibeggiatoa sp. nov. NOAA]|uniref:efflux RND transporter periplasmic adaptor subunit n=1 Tax=Candidatus Albibeggiatoa sp. nov. NOAA TaxID=3162724 RepID=UPI0032F383E8|nr:efflux RND transporter periplasmic adaptor subunit [Thiotrichaceae bacterium]